MYSTLFELQNKQVIRNFTTINFVPIPKQVDCFVATLLAMTRGEELHTL